MATKVKGCNGRIEAGSPIAFVGNVTQWSFQEAIKTGTKVLGGCDEPDDVETTGSMTVYWDPADVGQDKLRAGVTVHVELYPAGKSTGAKGYAADVKVESVNISGSGDNYVEATISWRYDGAMSEVTAP